MTERAPEVDRESGQMRFRMNYDLEGFELNTKIVENAIDRTLGFLDNASDELLRLAYEGDDHVEGESQGGGKSPR